MNQPWSIIAAQFKPGIASILFCALFAFQQGTAQHCFPGFHITVSGNTVAFTNTSTADGTITSYTWSFGDGHHSTQQNPIHTYSAPGTYNVCLTITAHNPNCSATFCHHVVVVAQSGTCHAAFSAHQPDLNHPTIHFTNQSTSDGTIGSWAWDFGDGSTSSEQNPVHTYAHPGTYTVCLTVTDDDGGCTSHVCQQVVVHHPVMNDCHAAYTIHLDTTGLGVQFTNTSTGTTGHTTYSWDFGDGTGSTEQNPFHAFLHNGHYTVCLFIADSTTGCAAHFCHTIGLHHTGIYHTEKSEAIEADPRSDAGGNKLQPINMAVYPNPVSGVLNVDYVLSRPGNVKFELISPTGASAIALAEYFQPAGGHATFLSLENLPAGTYFLRAIFHGEAVLQKVLVQ